MRKIYLSTTNRIEFDKIKSKERSECVKCHCVDNKKRKKESSLQVEVCAACGGDAFYSFKFLQEDQE